MWGLGCVVFVAVENVVGVSVLRGFCCASSSPLPWVWEVERWRRLFPLGLLG